MLTNQLNGDKNWILKKGASRKRKEGSYTDSIIDNLIEELECETVFSIGGIGIAESVVVTWIIMAVLVIASIFLTRNLKVENPGKRQLALEAAVGGLFHFFDDILGKDGRRYVPYLMTVALYIGVSNIIGIFGFKPPTKDLNVTIALAVMSIVLIEYSGFHKKGLKGFIRSFIEPVPVLLPINIMELFIKPVSLCMRLFGNVLGAFVIMELLKAIVPAIVPIPFSAYFDLFDGLIQAYVFVFLTTLFMSEQMETE